MIERVWTEAEIAVFKTAEPQLDARGMYVDGPKGEANGAQFMRWFDKNPQVEITVERLLWLFEEFKKYPNGIFFKSDAQMRFEKAAAKVAPEDLNTLERFLRANRLWPSDEEAYENACQFINYQAGRPYTFDVLAHLTLPQILGSSREPLHWKTPGQGSTYRLTGKHSDGDSHFAPRAETNIGGSFVGRIDHAKHPSTEIPRPAPASDRMNDYQWTQMANALCGDRHSDTYAIQQKIKAVRDQGETAEEAYREGVRVKNQIRMERERGR